MTINRIYEENLKLDAFDPNDGQRKLFNYKFDKIYVRMGTLRFSDDYISKLEIFCNYFLKQGANSHDDVIYSYEY